MDPSTATPTTDQNTAADLRAELYGDLVAYDAARDGLGVSRWTLSKLVREGRLSRVVVANRFFITRESLTTYIASVKAAARRPSGARPGASPAA